MLDAFNNIDKHRRLHVVRETVRSAKRPVFHKRYGFISKPKFGPTESGAKVDEWRFKFISDDMRDELARQVDMHWVSVEEVIDEGNWRLPVFEMAQTLKNEVIGVIRDFVPCFAAAGLSGDELRLPPPIKSQWQRMFGDLA